MKCARCSAEIPGQSQFCLRCGTPVHAMQNVAPSVRPMPAVVPAPTPNRALYGVIGVMAVALVAMALWFVKSSLAQKPGQTATPSLVQAPAQTKMSPLVQAPADSKPPTIVVAPPAPSEPQPNYSDIDDYLKFVRQVERTKQGLIRRQLAGALSTYGNALGNQVKAVESDESSEQYLANISKDPKNFSADWNTLTATFIGRQPPQSCVPLRDKYYTHLGKIQGMLSKVHEALSQAGSGNSGDALNALTGMMGTASADADETAQAADDALADICTTYKLEKTFKIQTDSGAGGSLLR